MSNKTEYQKILSDIKAVGLDFRINDLDEQLQVSFKGESFIPLNDTLQARIETAIAEIGYGVHGKGKATVTRFWNAAITLGDAQRFNPIKDFFKGLEGQYKPYTPPGHGFAAPYLVHKLAEYFDNPDKYFPVWLYKWGTGAIAKVFEKQRNPMLVLVSDQEKGKSYFAKWLCNPLGEDYFLEGSINPDSKDARLRLTDKFIHEVGELGATTRRADAEALKEFITKKQVSDRMPYAKRPINKPAVCSFIGSVNFDGAGFLNDPTGSSRFLACQIDNINFDYSIAIDPRQLWAEFYYFFMNAHRPYELTAQEKEARDIINAQFEMVSAIDAVVDDYIEVTGEPGDFMATIDIRNCISPHYRYSSETVFHRELSRSLHRFRNDGVEPAREPYISGVGHRRGYRGLKRRAGVILE